MPERSGHAHTRVKHLCSAAWRRRPPSRHTRPRLTWQLIDRGEVGGEKGGHEDRGGDAVMGAADDLQEQTSCSSQSNKVRRFWISKPGPLMRSQVLVKSRRFAGGADAGEPHPSDAGVR